MILEDSKPKRRPLIIAAAISVLAIAGIAFLLFRVVEWLKPPPIEAPPEELRSEPGLQRFFPTARRTLLARESPTSDEEEAPAVPPDHPFAKTKITGRVYDIETNEGIVGAIVRVRPSFGDPRLGPKNGDGSAAYTTRDDGSYAMKGIPPGTFDLEVDASGYAPARSSFKKFSALEDDDGFDVGLLRAGTIEGRVLTADRKPIAGARVTATAAEAVTIHEEATVVTTDDSGTFLIDPAELRELRVCATHPLYGTAVATLAVGDDPARRVELVLAGPKMLRGQVTDGSAPIAGAHVVLALQRSGDRMVATSPSASGFGVKTSDDGKFEVAVPDAGPLVVLASAPGFETASWMANDAATDALNADIVLRPAIEFTGRVLASNGAPASRAHVAVGSMQARGRPLDAWTDSDGRFRIDGVPKSGPYRVVIQHHEHPSLITVEEQIGGEHRYQLEAAGRILGVITDAVSGGPVTRYSYAVAGPVRRSASAVSISGSFEVDQLPEGNYSVSIDAEGYESAFVESVAVGAGETIQGINVRLKPAGAIVGRIRGGASGTVVVHAWDQESRLEAEAIASEDGAFSIDDLPSGTYTLTAVGDGAEGEVRGEVQNVSVQSGVVTRDVEIALSPVHNPG